MSKKQDISALHRLEFYKKQKAWCFSRQNICANVNSKSQICNRIWDNSKRPVKDTLIDTVNVKTRKSRDINRNCVTNQFQAKIKKPICEKQTRLACLFQYEMLSNKSKDVVDGGVSKKFDGKLGHDYSEFGEYEKTAFSNECLPDTLNRTYSMTDVPTSDVTFQTDTFLSQPYVLDNNNNSILKTAYCHDTEMLDDIQFEESNLTFDDQFAEIDDVSNIPECITSSFMMRKSKVESDLSASISENDFMDGISKTTHSSELDLANFDLVEEINSFVEMQMASFNMDKVGYEAHNIKPQEIMLDSNRYAHENPETMSYAELIKEISREHMHILHHSQRKQSLIQAICKKVVIDSAYDKSRSSGDMMYSDILGLPRGRGRLGKIAMSPGFTRDCSVGVGRGCLRKRWSDIE